MTRIAITEAAYAAFVAAFPAWALDAPQKLADGRLYIWLPKPAMPLLSRLRAPGEDWSAVLLRLAGAVQ